MFSSILTVIRQRVGVKFALMISAFLGCTLPAVRAQHQELERPVRDRDIEPKASKGAKEHQEPEHHSNHDPKSPNGGPIGPLPTAPAGKLIFANKVSPEFQKKIVEIAKDLGTDPNFLMAIMEFESGLDPARQNSLSKATGLIQFTEPTARGLGTSIAALKKMTAEEQLPFVAKHFAPHKGRLKNIDDAYMAVLFPKAIGRPSDFVLFSKDDPNPTVRKQYQQNKGLDKHPEDGKVTKAEAAVPVRAAFARGVKGLTAAPSANPAARPTPRTDTLFKTRHQHNRDRAKKGDVDVLFLGDSIMQGWESTGQTVFKKHFGSLKTANFGIGSDRTQNVLWRVTEGKELEGINPKVVVLLIGTNNIGANRPADIAEGVSAIMKAIQSQRPQTKILLMTIFPRGAHATDTLRKQVNETNTAILKFASSPTITFVELNPDFLDGSGNLRKDMLPDSVHPSARGYTLWAEAIRGPLQILLGEKTTVSNP